ncbi:uncharacterized protein LOC121734716 [Aricia agestis]|uniref:uncharacterized protein LOC121734716 n=1 Tax=Aricia agestis TaxID=91739 RepID=UPI001C2029BF|nr:uncharacterized protein LOC121734716 [Aricia agestis]
MKLYWYCFAAVLVTITHAAVDVEKTVQQVQSILKANTLLPRLSREEIIQLLNDIKAEDAKSSASREKSSEVTTTTFKSTEENEVLSISEEHSKDKDNKIQREVIREVDDLAAASGKDNLVESTTKSTGQTLTVVLPYTPRDGSSLQELYTRPPRLEIVTEKVTPKPKKSVKSNKNIQDILTTNSKIANNQKLDFPAELQAFLDSHGLKGDQGKDHFLLPLDGFKPLPPGKVVDGTVQLPENILLTYDLLSPSDLASSSDRLAAHSNANYLYEPLRPELPFELDTSASENKDVSLPYDMPKPRKTKSAKNYEPIDYDSVKVIPLNQGPSLVADESKISEQSKRQTNEANVTDDTAANETTTIFVPTVNTEGESRDETTTAATTSSAAPAADSLPADSDSGASIADLEDSFGGAAPEMPGDSMLPPPKKNGFYWMVDWNSFLEVGDGDTKVNIRFEPKLGDPQMFLPVNVP